MSVLMKARDPFSFRPTVLCQSVPLNVLCYNVLLTIRTNQASPDEGCLKKHEEGAKETDDNGFQMIWIVNSLLGIYISDLEIETEKRGQKIGAHILMGK